MNLNLPRCNNILSTAKLLFYSLAITTLQAQETPVELKTLTGVGYQDSPLSNGLQFLSMAGGAPIVVSGLNMAQMPQMNSIEFSPTFLTGIDLNGPVLSQNDEFRSNAMAGKVAYTTPSVMTLMNTPYDTFNGGTLPNGVQLPLTYNLKVFDADDGWTVLCASSNNCLVNFRRDFTPQLYDTIPANVYKDQMVQFRVNIKSAGGTQGTPADEWPFREIRLGKTLVDWSETVTQDQRPAAWNIDSINAYVTDQQPDLNTEPRLLFYPGYAVNMPSSKHCNFAGNDCWTVRTHPKIESISQNSGFTTGGQLLNITGFGLNGGNVSVTVDGVPCQVQTSDNKWITCITGNTSNSSRLGSQPGQPGLTSKKVNTNDGLSYAKLSNPSQYPVNETALSTSFETYAGNLDDSYMSALSGWFTAPVTGQYRFYLSCDDICQLLLDQVNPFVPGSASTPQPTQIAYRNYASNWRNYFHANYDDKHISDWISLQQGASYYISGQTGEWGGNEHFSVSVEVQPTNASANFTSSHPMSSSQIQQLGFDQINTPEIWSVTVATPDSGTYFVSLVDSTKKPAVAWKSGAIAANANAATFRNAIYPFYRDVHGSDISVVIIMFDTSGAVTLNAALATSFSYQITMAKQISGYSSKTATITKGTTLSSITVVAPPNGVASSAPLNGTFIVTCKDQGGVSYSTPEIKYNEWTGSIQNIISNYIPFLADKVQVFADGRYKYAENGLSFIMKINGQGQNISACQISSGSAYPITGNNPIANVTNLQNFGQTLMFEPVPLEFLTTDAQKPQVLVSVDGIVGLCANLNCDYIYSESQSIISTQSLSNGVLTITGTGLPSLSDVEISFGPVACLNGAVSSGNSDTLIVCKLNDTAVSGDWTVVVLTSDGFLPVQIDAPITVPIAVSSVTPNANVNPLGGQKLVIAGTNFGYDTSAINVTFADGTPCTVLSAASTNFTCLVNRLKDTTIVTADIIVTINGVQDTSLSVDIQDDVKTTLSVVPSSASPVLKTELVIYLSDDYTQTLAVDDFTVSLLNDNDDTFSKILFVMSVNQTQNSIKVKFPGAKSGNYTIQVSSLQYGNMMSDTLKLQVYGRVTQVTPSSGSIYGGALVTITGENFSYDPLDNPVKIGDDYCYVITSTPTQITCRTKQLVGKAEEPDLLLVFLKTSEEAQCDQSLSEFNYVTPDAAITSLEAIFNRDLKKHQVLITGTGFDNTIELFIDGIQQQLASQTESLATFNVVGLLNTTASDIQVFTSQGYPAGMERVVPLYFTPALLSITPTTGSSGGTWITVTGSGFGPQTKALNIIDSVSAKTICQSIQITSYGKLQCLTNLLDIAVGSALKVALSSKVVTASYIDPLAIYSQSAIVTVDSVTVSQNSIQFVGSGFPTSGYTAYASFGGVNATTVTITDANNAVASWDNTGLAGITATPNLFFQSNDNLLTGQFAKVASSATVSKTLSVTATSQNLQCSFAGGCTYAIESDGLFATLKNSQNSVSICGNKCVLRDDLSTAAYAVCDVPALATSYSAQQYQIVQRSPLNATLFPSNKVLFDNDVTKDFVDNQTTGCNFGMTFKKDYVAVLDEAKIFINFLTNSTPYVDNLLFEGSNDGFVTKTLLYTFGKDVHEGWNYIDYRNNSTKPAFNSYRFYGKVKGSCRVTEFVLTGIEAIADTSSTYSCTPEIKIGTTVLSAATAVQSVTYSSDTTPVLQSISPRFGSVLGNTTVTLTGTNLLGTSNATVLFDNRTCTIISQSSTQIKCITSDKPYVPDTPRVQITIPGMGLVATKGLTFKYVSLWSQTQTWGGDLPPLEGESISIPKGQHLLVDVDATPELNAIICEGSLIFAPDSDPNHERTFDAHYIMVFGGYMEVGTEQFPYTSKLTITMHSDKYSPYLPIYGNKVIGVRFGLLEMHGIPRNITWTRLAQTAQAGDTSITLLENTDWAAGEEIVIATTHWDNNQAETRIITQVQGKVLSFDGPLLYQHLSEVPVYDGIEIPMQGEVGLLTRNVKYRGDPETSPKNLYGAHIMVHSPGDESSIGRIEYIELKDVGQAFKLGRYPIHFHCIGTVHQSYVRGNAIHQTYNRAVTTHTVHYFRVINNVAFDTMGHTYFVEDGVETNNLYDHNLAIQVKKSNSLLNTDQTPGGFWITNPNNQFRNNAIAGGDAYGYWFDLDPHSGGMSFDINVCPMYTRLGEFRDNSAHSMRKYGLRLFHALMPRQYPCAASRIDGDYLAKGKDDPFWLNPKIPATFENMLAWKCGRNGAITERTGAVTFKNFKIADSRIAGIEFSFIEDVADGDANISGGIIVGNTYLNDDDDAIKGSTVWGFIGPRTENFTMSSVRFYNFDFQNSSAIGTCSHCFHPASTDSGGRTFTVSNLTFDAATVPRRINWGFPYREIIYDLDGSLTGLGPKTWATPYWVHNVQPECQVSLDVHRGIICNSNVQVRRVAFFKYAPLSITMMKLKIAKWDHDIENAIKADNTSLFNFQQDVNYSYFSRVDQRNKLNPALSWTMPYVTGHRYRIHWGENNDFEMMHIEISERWTPNDLNLHFMTNFTDVRASINITAIQAKNELIANMTYLKPENQLVAGDNVIYNQTEVREFMFVINGKNMTSRKNLRIDGFRCVVNCIQSVIQDVAINTTAVLWSQTSSWQSGKLPVLGEDVEILPGVNMILDIETPLLKKLTVNGRLTFLYNQSVPQNITLHTKILYVRAGELLIGNATHPYNGNATIKLYGQPTDETIAFSPEIETGNKVLAIVGTVKFFGKNRDRMSRLRATSFKNDKIITVYPGLDWQTGDRLAIIPTATQFTHTDYVVIQSYDNQTGVIILANGLQYYHWGQLASTETKYNGVDTRGEVILLNRNVKVVGNDSDSWGGQIMVSDNVEDTGVKRSGQLIFDNVEIYNCSQRNTFKSAIRFEGVKNLTQVITNSVVNNGLGWSLSVQESANIFVQNSSFVGSKAIGIAVWTSQNVTLDNIFVGDVLKRDVGMVSVVDREACISICAYLDKPDFCSDVSLTNSVVAGCTFAGVIAMGHECGESETQKVVKNVVAHSISGSGFHIYPDPTKPSQDLCYEGSYLSAYKCSQIGIGTMYKSQEIRMLHTTMIDNSLGICLQTGKESSKNLLLLQDSHIYGETEALDCPKNHPCWCPNKMAFMLFGGNEQGKDPHITSLSKLPHYKIKSYGSWTAATDLSSIVFENFKSNVTTCGAGQSIFGVNKYSSDYIPIQNFSNTQFVNVHDSAMAYFYDPPEEWNNVDDCVGFPCTAPSNIVMTFTNTQYLGTIMPKVRATEFQIISDTPGASETISKCQFKEPWNAWTCTNPNIGVLLAQGLDPDWQDRSVAPVYVTNDALNYTNKINSQMDHSWDGFYTGQLHKSMFQSFIQTTGNWTVTYTGTPFKNMRYTLRADQGQIKVKVPYWNAGAYGIKVNNKTINPTAWDTNLGQQAELTGRKGCGENRFVGVKNFLEFILTPDCELFVFPIDAILSNVRMSWTMDQFYAAGGVTSFADRVSAALGISASQVKVVAVYKGSVVVDYQIQASSSDTNSAATLSKLTNKLNTLITANNSAVFGAPVLSASTGGKTVVNDPNYNPNVNVNPRVSSFFPGPVTNSTTQVQKVTVVEEESNSVMTLSLKMNSGLLWIIVVLVIVFVSCFCCGTAVFCLVKHRAKQLEANKKAAGTVEIVKNDPNLASEVDLRPQYHPNEEIDFDIFANKKRDFKINDDYVNITEQSSFNNLVSSEKKLITSTAPDVNNNIDV